MSLFQSLLILFANYPPRPYPPWLEALMHDTRFLAHIVLPETVHQSQHRQPHLSTRFHPSVRGHRDRNFGSTVRRRHLQHYQHTQQSVKRRPPVSRNPIPAAYYPQQVISLPRASYQSAALSPIHLLRRPVNWRRGYQSPSKGGLGRYLSRLGSLIREHNGLFLSCLTLISV